jgi:cobyrinic acid a,c-diamide synthase
MGYYDGIAATPEASAYTVAKETRTPVILVVSARGAAYSLAATLDGFARLRPDGNICGVVFNNANESRYPDLEKIAGSVGVRAFGFLPENADWTFQSRRLGLLSAGEVADLHEKITLLGCRAEQSIDIEGITAAAESAPALPGQDISGMSRESGAGQTDGARAGVRVAVAKDEAFCFMYEENLETLRALGCEIIFFSPLRDRELPENVDGLYLCGGYPELFAETLSANASMLCGIKRAVEGGLPTIAECGGFLYLHRSLGGFPMCGAIRSDAFDAGKLRRFGYVTLTAERDNLLCRAGGSIRAHEFHYWDSGDPGGGFTARKAGRDISYACVHATETLYAGFPHLYFPANPEFAEKFVIKMAG